MIYLIYQCHFTSMNSSIQTTVELESQTLRFDAVHKIWGQVELKALSNKFDGFDLVVAIDCCASMEYHLEMVQWLSRFILNSLDERHTFTLICYNRAVLIPVDCFPCTSENKLFISKLLGKLQCDGVSNILECLKSGAKILNQRINQRLCAFAIFTDGRHQFIFPDQIMTEVKKINIPCSVNTFGLGRDQDSGLLHAIAHQTHGVYQNIQTSDQVPMIINSFMDSLHNICATNICITLKCHDGARLVTLATPYKIEEKIKLKEYTITIPTISKNNLKTILFRLSLRKMDAQMQEHQLITVNISADCPNQEHMNTSYGPFSIARTSVASMEQIPATLDCKLNHYMVATTINDAIEMAVKQNYIGGFNKLKETIASINRSVSGDNPFTQVYINNLEECLQYINNDRAFLYGGVHSARMLASEYFMEYRRTIPLRWSYPTPQLTYVFALAYGESS